MAKRKIIRKSNKTLNLFVDGGELKQTWGQQAKTAFSNAFDPENLKETIGGMNSAVNTITNAGIQNAQIANTSNFEKQLEQAQAYKIQANNNDDLMSEWNIFSPIENISWKDIRGSNNGQRFGNTIGSISSGVATGATVGGLPGALMGGIIGLGSAIGSWINGNKKAKKKARGFNEQINTINEKNMVALKDKVGNIDMQNDFNMFANFSAHGGPINIKKSNRGKFTEAAKRAGMGVQEYARHILANKDRYSPTLVKRANFARNASKWKHATGGLLEGQQYQSSESTVEEPDEYSNTPIEESPVDNFRDKVRKESSIYNRNFLEDLKSLELKDSLLSNTSGYIDEHRLNKYKTALNNNDYYTALNLGVYNIDKNNNLYFRDMDTEKANKVSSYLKKKGLTKNQYGVVMDNIYRESGFDHTAGHKYKNGDEDYGLFQFTNSENSDSLSKYRQFLKDNNKEDGIESQIDFFLEEYLPSRPEYETWNQKDADINQLSDFMFQKVLSPKKSIREDSRYIERQRRAANALSNTYAEGGSLTHGGDFTNGVTIINNGGSHEENPMEGVPMGIAPDGTPNLVEEGEVKFNDYIFSNRLFADSGLLAANNLPITYVNHSFADIAERLSKESSERPNDPISKRGLMSAMTRLQQAQEQVRMEEQSKRESRGKNLFVTGGPTGIDPALYEDEDEYLIVPTGTKIIGNPFISDDMSYQATITPSPSSLQTSEEDKQTPPRQGRGLTWLRYAPVIGSGLNVFTDAVGWTNEPDYTNTEIIGKTADNLSTINFNPLSNYLTYKPFDRNYYLNKLNAQAGATRRAIIDQSGGNRATALANLLAADYNTLNLMGDLARQAEEYNQAQKERVETFNRGTNQFNSEMALKAAMANKENEKLRLYSAIQQAQMKENIDARSSAAKSANLTNLFDNLGNIGIDTINRGDRNMLIESDALGDYSYQDLIRAGFSKKDAIRQLRKQGWKDEDLKREGIIKAYGGKINTRRRRGLTF